MSFSIAVNLNFDSLVSRLLGTRLRTRVMFEFYLNHSHIEWGAYVTQASPNFPNLQIEYHSLTLARMKMKLVAEVAMIVSASRLSVQRGWSVVAARWGRST